MNFLEQLITIKDNKTETPTRQVTAWIGEGTGLAYYLASEGNINLYKVTHVQSGYALPLAVDTTEEARTYLEKLSCIFADKWNCDLVSLKKRIARDPHKLRVQVELAHYDSLAPHVDYFLYAVTGDEDLCGESEDAVGKDPQSPENEKIAQQLLAEYPEATKAIMASVADADGLHKVLRTFERVTVALGTSTEE